jgi:hypothetical protein
MPLYYTTVLWCVACYRNNKKLFIFILLFFIMGCYFLNEERRSTQQCHIIQRMN